MTACITGESPSTPAAAPRAGRREWFGLVSLLLPVFLASMDVSVLYLAMPRLTDALAPSAAEQLWILDVYGFLLAGLLVTMGNLGDRIGRRRLMLWGATLFGIASTVAAFAPSAEFLIAARAVMGIGGATLLPASLALISNMFTDARQKGLAVGIWAAAFSFGAAVGPVVGGVLLHHFWWGSVFLINVPVLAVLLLTAPWLVPEYRNGATEPFDLLGVVLSMASIMPLVYAVKTAATHGLTLATFVSAGVGAVALVVFIAQQLRTPRPLLALDLFRNRTFTVTILGTIGAMATLGSVSYLTGVFLQSVLEYDVLTAALLGLPMAVVVAYASMVAPRIERRIGRRWTFVGALLAAAIGNALLLLLSIDGTALVHPVGVYIASTVIAGAGYGVMFTFASAVALDAAPAERAGQATGISEMSFELGTAFGLAILGSLATAVYTASASEFPAVGGRELGIDAGDVDETLGGTLARARELGGDAGAALIETARQGWVDGIGVTAALSTLILVAVAVAVGVTMRRR